MLRKVEPSRTKSEQSLLQARDWLSEAEKNLEAEALRSAISSAYLAVFHSARALLFRDGVREKSHYCIGLYLQKYVVEGTLEEEVQEGIDLAERFIERMEKLLRETK
jgi:uncharacterized protein (UPF0332 family)